MGRELTERFDLKATTGPSTPQVQKAAPASLRMTRFLYYDDKILISQRALYQLQIGMLEEC
jgi:hypothetical protein